MNFDGFTPYPIERFSSLVEQDDPTNLPLGVSPLARNVKFRLTRAITRDGIQNSYGFALPDGGAVTGLASLKYSGNPDVQVPIAFSALGDLYKESPAGSGNVVKITSSQLTLPANASMQLAAAYQKGYLAFGDLVNSLSGPAVCNLETGVLDPLSMLPVGNPWQAGHVYQVGECVTPASPVGGNGKLYRCTVAGTSGNAQPAFPLGEQATVVDGTVTWQENTPVMAQAIPEWPIPVVNRVAGAGTFAAGRDVYILVTLVNGVGETDGQTVLAARFVNTVLNDRFAVTGPAAVQLAKWIQDLPVPYAVTGYNVYEADVATGSAAPGIGAYAKVNVAPVALGVNTNVDTSGAGAGAPTTNGALVVPVGNICAGLRYMVTLFLNRNGYITGMSEPSVVSYDGSSDGFQLFVAHIPKGPANTAARICCFTPAGQLSALAGTGISTAGPYFWISPNFPSSAFTPGSNSSILSSIPGGVTIGDVVNGIQITSTLINDNVTTSATFNFTDDYLKLTLQDVSAYFRKIQMQDISDVFYSKIMKRMFYASDSLPSGWYVSLVDDPESVYGDTGIVQVAENTGERRTAIREFGGVLYLLKERSGHVLNPSSDEPNKWQPVQQWGVSKDGTSIAAGPCGPRAVDVCSSFMCFVHRSGVYIYESGLPYLISKEIPITWSQINWAYQKNIWVMIDDETREIRIGVPYGQSTVPNIVLKCNYEEVPALGPPRFLPPIHFSPYIGKEIASGTAYKWSIDDIAANVCIRADRTLQTPPGGFPAGFDLPTVQSQILYGSSNADGEVSPIIPGTLDDNGVGIDSQIETSCPVIVNGDGKVVKSLMGPSRLGGVQLNIDGQGQGGVFVLALRAKDPKQGGPPLNGKSKANAGAEIRLKKPWIAGTPYSCGGNMTNERMRLRVTNDCQPGVGFDLKWAAIYAQPVTSARPN